jgi:hypothetical protein
MGSRNWVGGKDAGVAVVVVGSSPGLKLGRRVGFVVGCSVVGMGVATIGLGVEGAKIGHKIGGSLGTGVGTGVGAGKETTGAAGAGVVGTFVGHKIGDSLGTGVGAGKGTTGAAAGAGVGTDVGMGAGGAVPGTQFVTGVIIILPEPSFVVVISMRQEHVNSLPCGLVTNTDSSFLAHTSPSSSLFVANGQKGHSICRLTFGLQIQGKS